jgi:hypothetical protein
VSEFYAGVVSSLIGAFIGGLLTAAVALVQVRANNRLVMLQLDRSHRQQLEAMHTEFLRAALLELNNALVANMKDLDAYAPFEAGGECRSPCDEDQFYLVARRSYLRLSELDLRYHAVYPDSICTIFDELLGLVPFTRAGATEGAIAILQESEDDYSASKNCEYCDAASELATKMQRAAREVGEIARSISKPFET